jgi:hypothetical protein
MHEAGEAQEELIVRRRTSGNAGDACMHRLDQTGKTSDDVGAQPGGAAQVGGLQKRFRHGRAWHGPAPRRQNMNA